MCNREAASPLPHNSPSHQGYISPCSPSALLGWCCVVCIVSAPLKQTLPPHAQEWPGIPTSSPCPTVRPPATCERDAAVSQMLCSRSTPIVPCGTCYMCHAVGPHIAIITRMMQGDPRVNEHTMGDHAPGCSDHVTRVHVWMTECMHPRPTELVRVLP